MMQIELSSDLNVITAEINSFKQIAGQSLFEIGKRLKHVRDNDLARGQWLEWLRTVDIAPRTAQAFIQAYEQFGNTQTSAHLPTGKIFEMLSLPESIDRQDFITKSHIIPSTGESKTVDEMTVKELREVKKALQQAERAKAEAEARATAEADRAKQLERMLEAERRKPPQVVEKTPDDYEEVIRQNQELNIQNVALARKMREMQEEFSQKVTRLDETHHAVRKIRESFKNIFAVVSQEHYNAKFLYEQIPGNAQAHQAVETFLIEFGDLVSQIMADWKNAIEIQPMKRSV